MAFSALGDDLSLAGDRAISTIAKERSGLRCALSAGGRAANCVAFAAGPRTSLAMLKAGARTIAASADAAANARASLPLANATLAPLLDIGDASSLDYDATVESLTVMDL